MLKNKFILINLFLHSKERLTLMTLALVQVLISFATIFLVVKKIGFSDELDVFYLAMAVFNFLSTSIGWSISSVLTTILIKNKEDNLEGKMFFNVLLITIFILVLSLGTMYLWLDLIFINYLDFVGHYKIIIVQSLLIITFSIGNLNIVFIAMLQASNQYVKINILNMLAAIFGFLIVFVYIENFGLYAAAISQLGIQVFLFLIMFFSVIKTKKLNITFDKDSFNLLWDRMKYIVIGSSFYRTEELVERFISSYLSTGFLSLVGFVQRVYGGIITVLNTSIAGPTITKFSYLVKNKEFDKINYTLKKYLILLFAINALLFVAVVFAGEELFMYFFSERINNSILPMVFITLLLSFTMVLGNTLGQVMHNLLLSMQLEKILTIYDSATFTINTIIKVVCAVSFGMTGFLIGIAVSILIKNLAKAYLLFKYLKKFNSLGGLKDEVQQR